MGKTSLLKQLELLTSEDRSLGFFPIFWDLQGSAEPEELHLDFQEALLDAEERFEELGINIDDVLADDAFLSLSRLRRRLKALGLRLLILCDETEELISLAKKDPALLRKMRRALHSREDVRSVLASTIRLWALAELGEDTSPFLHGFAPPLYIERLTDSEARALLQQASLPDESKPAFSDGEMTEICQRCDNHPYLLQLLSKRFLELGNLEEAVEQVSSDRMVSFFFAVDFDMLSEEERLLLGSLAGSSPRSSDSLLRSQPAGVDMQDALHRLENLGFLRRGDDRRYRLENFFFRTWLEEERNRSPAPARVTPPTAQTAEQTETLIQAQPERIGGRYQVLSKIGEGAMGLVYKAHDTLLRSTIAIKVLRPELSSNEDLAERFRREILLSRDLGHPNVLRIYHLGEDGGQRYLTMAWVDGGDLATELTARGRFQPSDVARIGAKVASALQAAHRAGVHHRDIKPKNILIDHQLEPFVTDFGLAHHADQPALTQAGAFVGTPNYASPEQAESIEVGARSDVYSLGVVLFEMLVGRLPFQAKSSAEMLRLHRHEPPPDLGALAPEAPDELTHTIMRCLEKRPAERQDSEELYRALAG